MTDALIVACPACNTLNRAPREKLAAGSSGKCGHCGSPLFGGHPVALNAQSFETHATKSDIPLLVDFWAPWCGPCKAMAPQFEKAAGSLEPQVRLAKVNTDDEQALAGRFGIPGHPDDDSLPARQGNRPPVRRDECGRHRELGPAGASLKLVLPSSYD